MLVFVQFHFDGARRRRWRRRFADDFLFDDNGHPLLLLLLDGMSHDDALGPDVIGWLMLPLLLLLLGRSRRLGDSGDHLGDLRRRKGHRKGRWSDGLGQLGGQRRRGAKKRTRRRWSRRGIDDGGGRSRIRHRSRR